MKNHFKKLKHTEELDDLLARSKDEPIAIFKHSMTCPISASAYREMTDYGGGGIALVEIQNSRDLSREIGDRTGVEHESPQVIVLRNGKAVWHASHWNVTAAAVEQAMLEHA